MIDWEDQPPYSMIGSATTIHGPCRGVVNRPIGFIWPKAEKGTVMPHKGKYPNYPSKPGHPNKRGKK